MSRAASHCHVREADTHMLLVENESANASSHTAISHQWGNSKQRQHGIIQELLPPTGRETLTGLLRDFLIFGT